MKTMKAIVKAPFPVKPPSFMKLDETFGDLLVRYIVDQNFDVDEEDLGNLDEPSEE